MRHKTTALLTRLGLFAVAQVFAGYAPARVGLL